VVALVNRKATFDLPAVTFMEFPRSKRSWALRLYYEYWYFRQLSKKLKPLLWLSLHDTSPWVVSARQAVYCHNPAPFHRLSLSEILWDPPFALFSWFYRWVYRFNIHANDVVIVQQEWLRERFIRDFNLQSVLVAHPEVSGRQELSPRATDQRNVCRFIYPALPRIFKNHGLLCRAAEYLSANGTGQFEVILTFDGSESRYSRELVNRFKSITQLKFIGAISRERVFDFYRTSDCLIFPSKLETWGLPLSEFKTFGKPILASHLEFARETIGNYERASFFDPDDVQKLAALMRSVIDGKFIPAITTVQCPQFPYTNTWEGLFAYLFSTKFAALTK